MKAYTSSNINSTQKSKCFEIENFVFRQFTEYTFYIVYHFVFWLDSVYQMCPEDVRVVLNLPPHFSLSNSCDIVFFVCQIFLFFFCFLPTCWRFLLWIMFGNNFFFWCWKIFDSESFLFVALVCVTVCS